MLLCRTVNTGFGIDFQRLLDSTPSPILEQWRVLYDMEPWDGERTDEAFGTLIANLFAAHGISPLPPREYMRLLRAKQKPQTEREMKAVFDDVCRHVEKRYP